MRFQKKRTKGKLEENEKEPFTCKLILMESQRKFKKDISRAVSIIALCSCDMSWNVR